ncbi:hypothetical protein [Microbispora sp. GKU 823]|uniref:hypothetical protein n=1 Tax=Microbispora sp. GKU 823 TaxID=1652100 RepID=UPI0015C42D7C|nr:hypothetical protein [Microbispora sp. GKU 823]
MSGGVELHVEAAGPRAPFQFAVFRFDRPARRQDFGDAAHLVAVVPAGRHVRWVDPDGAPGHRYHVTAVDRASRQSEPSHERRVH